MSTDLAAVARRRETIKSAPRVVRSPCWFDQKSNRSSSSSSPAGGASRAPTCAAGNGAPLAAAQCEPGFGIPFPPLRCAPPLPPRRERFVRRRRSIGIRGEVRTTSERQPRPDTQTMKSPRCGGAFQVGDSTPSSYCGAKDQSGNPPVQMECRIFHCAPRAPYFPQQR